MAGPGDAGLCAPGKAVEMIRRASGVPVVAHPATGVPDHLIYALRKAGVGGVEVYHPEHNKAAEQKYLHLARKLGIAAMGGSDFHVKGVRNIGCRVTTVSQLEVLSRFRED